MYENTFGFWQVKWSHQMLSYNFCNSVTSHRCSAILLPRNISTTKALSVDKPTKSQLSHWNSQPSSTREALLNWFRLKQIINRAAQDLGCFSGFDQQHKPGHQLLAFGYFNSYFFWYLTHISINICRLKTKLTCVICQPYKHLLVQHIGLFQTIRVYFTIFCPNFQNAVSQCVLNKSKSINCIL